jgi:hypothetical protein
MKPKALLIASAAAALCIGVMGGHVWTKQRERSRCLFFAHGMAQSTAYTAELGAWRAYLSEPPAVGAWALESLAALCASFEHQFEGTAFAEADAWGLRAGSAHALLAKRYRDMGNTEKSAEHEAAARERLDPGQDVFQHAELMEKALPKALEGSGRMGEQESGGRDWNHPASPQAAQGRRLGY